jgi:hypothetical protein
MVNNTVCVCKTDLCNRDLMMAAGAVDSAYHYVTPLLLSFFLMMLGSVTC